MERAESRVTWPPAHAAEACRHHGEPGTGLEQRPQSAEPTPGSWRQVSVTARDRVSTVLSRGPEALSSGGPGADPARRGERGAVLCPQTPLPGWPRGWLTAHEWAAGPSRSHPRPRGGRGPLGGLMALRIVKAVCRRDPTSQERETARARNDLRAKDHMASPSQEGQGRGRGCRPPAADLTAGPQGRRIRALGAARAVALRGGEHSGTPPSGRGTPVSDPR